ncbi:ABC transporter permease [Deltaproteobacteria bacterium Smac51]|nr:ABC transporter permease [Deltaproteobacteria bacterium Smac51]
MSRDRHVNSSSGPLPFKLEADNHEGGSVIRLTGDLTVDVPAEAWKSLDSGTKGPGKAGKLRFDLSGLTALDLNGSAQLLTIADRAGKGGASIEGLPERFETIFNLAKNSLDTPMEEQPDKPSFIESLGKVTSDIKDDAVALITFHGELLVEMARSIIHPGAIRWNSVFSVAETAGVNAVPIVSLVSFLVGLIIAFQAAMLMKMFGAEIYVADLIGIAVIRELGPLIAGIVLAGRSGSAFSAELGAMKAAEEVDAITTMGLSPVRELALPRVLASVITTPMVTIIASFMGIVGGSVVLLAMGYAPGVYWSGAISQVSMASFLIGTFKSFIFGFTLSSIGCQRGLEAGDGPGAVGMATTSGVVTNIVVIAVLDSLFAVVFYVLDI